MQGANRYAYVVDNPLTLTDSSGMWPWDNVVKAVTQTVAEDTAQKERKMGHFSEVHGYITCLNEFEEANRQAIQEIPADDVLPQITGDMFATPHHIYSEQLIIFGQAYNGVERYWDQWLEKFETILRKLYWYEAHVYLRTEQWGEYHYSWLPDDMWVNAVKNQTWAFSGGPRTPLRAYWENREQA